MVAKILGSFCQGTYFSNKFNPTNSTILNNSDQFPTALLPPPPHYNQHHLFRLGASA